MFSREKFIKHVLGDNSYKIIDKSLELLGEDNWSIYNVSMYLKNNPFGTFILNDDVSLFYENNTSGKEKNGKTMKISFPNGIINMYFKNEYDLVYYDYREMLLSNGLLHFEYQNGKSWLTEYFDKETCDLGNICETSDLDVLREQGFSPDYIEEKSKAVGKYKLDDLLSQLNNLKTLRQTINVPPSKERR